MTRFIGLLLLALLSPTFATAASLSEILISRADVIAGGKSANLKEVITEIAASGDPDASAVFTLWLDGDLFFRKADNLIVRATKTDTGYDLFDPLSGREVGSAGKRDVKKVKNSTPIKKAIRPALAGLNLRHPEPAVRLNAAQQIAKKPNAIGRNALNAALPDEKDPEIRAAFIRALTLAQLEIGTPQQQRETVTGMGLPLDSESRAALQRLADNDDTDEGFRDELQTKLAAIEKRVRLYSFGNDLLFGLSRASVLLLSAIGLAITFGVMRVINMAHGEFIMMGAYTTFVIQSFTGMSAGLGFVVSLPLAFIVGFCFGVLLERLVIRHLYGRPLETLLATFGVSLFIQQLFRLIFNPQNKPVITPSWLTGNISFNPILGITTPRLFLFLFALIVFAALVVFLQRSRFGLEMRAVTQNRAIARTMGINSGRVDYLTFGLGSGIAGLAGAVLSQVLKVNPEMGAELIIPSFMVVVVGGVGNLWGTLLGAGLVGMATKLVEPWFPNNTLLATALIFGGVILFIQFRPKGIFAQKGRATDL